MANSFIIDIETGPLPDSELEKVMPFFAAPSNYKDEAKIAANIIEQQEKFKERAALSALTGQILIIGLRSQGKNEFFDMNRQTEKDLLEQFWSFWRQEIFNNSTVTIGFNIFQFDLPFIVRRSWKHGIKPPNGLMTKKYWDTQFFIDLREVWQLADREDGTLDQLLAYFGLQPKAGSGKDFARLWETDRPKALEYLAIDLQRTEQLADCLGVSEREPSRKEITRRDAQLAV